MNKDKDKIIITFDVEKKTAEFCNLTDSDAQCSGKVRMSAGRDGELVVSFNVKVRLSDIKCELVH